MPKVVSKKTGKVNKRKTSILRSQNTFSRIVRDADVISKITGSRRITASGEQNRRNIRQTRKAVAIKKARKK